MVMCPEFMKVWRSEYGLKKADRKSGWQRIEKSIPNQNNSLESRNNTIKEDCTNRKITGLAQTTSSVLDYFEHVSKNDVEFHTSPVISRATWIKGQFVCTAGMFETTLRCDPKDSTQEAVCFLAQGTLDGLRKSHKRGSIQFRRAATTILERYKNVVEEGIRATSLRGLTLEKILEVFSSCYHVTRIAKSQRIHRDICYECSCPYCLRYRLCKHVVGYGITTERIYVPRDMVAATYVTSKRPVGAPKKALGGEALKMPKVKTVVKPEKRPRGEVDSAPDRKASKPPQRRNSRPARQVGNTFMVGESVSVRWKQGMDFYDGVVDGDSESHQGIYDIYYASDNVHEAGVLEKYMQRRIETQPEASGSSTRASRLEVRNALAQAEWDAGGSQRDGFPEKSSQNAQVGYDATTVGPTGAVYGQMRSKNRGADLTRLTADVRRLFLGFLDRLDLSAPMCLGRTYKRDVLAELSVRYATSLAAANRCKVELSIEDNARVEEALTKPLDTQVARAFNSEIHCRGLSTLCPDVWLSEAPINYFMDILQDLDCRLSVANLFNKRSFKKSHFLNSFFMDKLLGTKQTSPPRTGVIFFSGVSRWTKFDIFELAKLYVPININNSHWCLLVVDFDAKTVRYYDSLGGPGTVYINAMRSYLNCMHQARKGGPMNEEGWRNVYTTVGDDTPRQTNGVDCGVFTTFCAYYLAHGVKPSFNQTHIATFRRRMMSDILKTGISSGV